MIKLTLKEEEARQKLLRTKPKPTSRRPGPRSENEYAQGKHSSAVRVSFRRAKPILDQIEKEYPKIDRLLVLGCLKEQTIVAENWPTQQDRKKAAAWKRLCKAWIGFCATANQTPTLEALKDIQKSLARQGHTTHDPRYLWVKWFKKWPEFFQGLQATHHLPAPEAIGNKGRPTSWWSDGQARKLADHFREKTGTPQWKLVSALLECAPPIRGLKMSQEHIRQRLNRWNRDKQQALMMRLAGTR
jgi:hypothetical protein